MARLFISQARLDAWTEEGKLSMDGDTLTLSELGRSFSVSPAVRFLRVVGGDEDPHQFVDLVMTEEKLAELGADCLATSVIFEDTAYEVQPGFLGVAK